MLAALPDADFQSWLPDLEPVDMPLGKVLHEAGRAPGQVYFPTTSIVSLQHLLSDGHSAEFAVVGNEGVVGIPLFMGGDSTTNQAIVQTAGRGLRLCARTLQRSFEQRGAVTHLMLRYAQALLTQVAQSAVCSRHHALEHRFCRLLLLCLDRLPDGEIVATHDRLAGMLGVRRESVTAAAHSLHETGLIRCSRGHITVVDRPGLERRACECYAVVRTEYERLLPDRAAS